VAIHTPIISAFASRSMKPQS